MNNKIFPLTLLIATFAACSTAPSHVVIAPEIHNGHSTNYPLKQAKISVTDLRPSTHIVQILRIDEASQLFSSQESLQTIVKQTITSAFKERGLTNDQFSDNQITIIIDSALISVQQELIKYQANNEITLRAEVLNGDQTLTKTFKIQGKSSGSLTADLAVLERDFNRQLANLLTQIVDNDEIQQFIK